MKPHSALLRHAATATVLALVASPALAHPGHGIHSHTFLSGFWHPLSGLDHIMAMVAVGIWAAFLGGRALWAVPTAFVTAMIAGFVLGVNGVIFPAVEPGIAASVVVMGLLIAVAVRMPMLPSLAVVGLFGLFHGDAHGMEMSGTALAFGAGFTVSTILLHLAGIVLGASIGRRQILLARAMGVVVAASGLFIAGDMIIGGLA
ncbi:HupE/UreJ family protein [Pontibaca methylaminivorans]|uniref:Urease accessory protein n=1 Tax=Pontibaca methylaminivorans TaxID=515897 RepID=A0A1R3X870_9RHOB|nr:HupE/UreJ family protein [Pontibaca methylaminivorans]SIT87154.1 urease accessory protein [Pontibaca methylaminivorans]